MHAWGKDQTNPIKPGRGIWIFALLGAAVVSLACAIVGMFVARAHLFEASNWVQHTSDVELTIAACRIHVREAQVYPVERPALLAKARADAERIRWLTADNPPQELRARALVQPLQTFDGDASMASQVDLSLRELAIVEGSLKEVRVAALYRAWRTGWLVSSVSTALTVLLVTLVLSLLYRQSQALTRADANLKREGAMLRGLSLSMGMTFFAPEQPLPLRELMVEADRLMYADKREQRRAPMLGSSRPS